MKKKITEVSSKSQLAHDEGEEDWLTDPHWPDPDPKKVDAVMPEIAQYISDFVDRAAFDFLLTDGKFMEFDFPDDPDAPKPPEGESIPAWKMKWYSTLDPLFLLYLNRRAQNFNLVRYDSQPDALSAHALSTLRETSDQLMLRMEHLPFTSACLWAPSYPAQAEMRWSLLDKVYGDLSHAVANGIRVRRS